jgi:hypothetical protein
LDQCELTKRWISVVALAANLLSYI